MFADGIFPIGDGMLDIDEEFFKELLVTDDINEIYDVESSPFARGKFAAVRRAIHKRSGAHFAAKFLKRRRRAQSSDKEIKHEIAVLMLCKEANNIVKLSAVHESRSDTALLLELAIGGELQTVLDNEECLSEAEARICMREVLKALQFLHTRSVAHLDLKPQNILLVGERIEDGLKLCDFGISRVVAEGTNVREIVGTPDYVAPEVLQYEPLSLLTDIWSAGVLAYVLLSGFSPFGGESKQETFLNISQCSLTFPEKLFSGISLAAIDFIRKALQINPSDRMTAAGCLDHIWLKDEVSIDRQLITKLSKQQAKDENISIERFIENGLKDSSSTKTISGDGLEEDGVICFAENSISKCNSSTIGDKIKAKATVTITAKSSEMHNMPAVRARTVPLCSVQQLPPKHLQRHQTQIFQEHKFIHIPARRHSSESNKENNFVVTKHITAMGYTLGSANEHVPQLTTLNRLASNAAIVTCTQLANHIDEHNSSNDSSNVFPDAPTTPKVIRKTHQNDASSNSVKALVKKFQLKDDEQSSLNSEFGNNSIHNNTKPTIEMLSLISSSPQFIQSLKKKVYEPNKIKFYNSAYCNKPSAQSTLLSSTAIPTSTSINVNDALRRISESAATVRSKPKLSFCSSSAPKEMLSNIYKSSSCVYCFDGSSIVPLAIRKSNAVRDVNADADTIESSECRHSNSLIGIDGESKNEIHSSWTAEASRNDCMACLHRNDTAAIMNMSSNLSTTVLFTKKNKLAINSSYQASQIRQHSYHTHLHQSNSYHHHHDHYHQHHHLRSHHLNIVKNAVTTSNGLNLDQSIIC